MPISPINRSPGSRLTEMSRLASRREPGGLGHMWRNSNQTQALSAGSNNVAGQLVRAANKQAAPKPMASSGMHPFKIYQLPFMYRTGAIDYSTIWRTVRVRAGLILNSTVDDANLPTGTDKVDQPYDDVFLTQSDGAAITGVSDIVVPDGEQNYWFWVDTGTNEICYGADPTAPDHGAAWGGFPNADSTRIVIGYADTLTLTDERRMIIRQIQYTDIVATGGGATISTFHFKQSFKDYFTTYEGTSVAKPYKLRNSITSEKIYGTTVNYTYPHNTGGDSLYGLYRTATISGVGSENQGVVPQYIANPDSFTSHGDIIYAIPTSTGIVSEAADESQTVGTPVGYLDLNVDGRAWARFSNQSF